TPTVRTVAASRSVPLAPTPSRWTHPGLAARPRRPHRRETPTARRAAVPPNDEPNGHDDGDGHVAPSHVTRTPAVVHHRGAPVDCPWHRPERCSRDRAASFVEYSDG